ncbi:hypothetical protein [Microbacterium sp. cx-59]|uniref:hypothetical protein n=1 Tax=Microbacterium sp. cx-59 TaxID=2891207 RepID=UPI001E4BC6DA|nr:hypothetical protein [Microbacterium sp. cx-59]MCC4908466.1 hypothetical protein [Microbacterium sp. cx-59]
MNPFEEKTAKVSDLRLDLRNPRMPDDQFADEDEAIEYLVRHAAVEELVESIGSSGWFDYEPLIVLSSEDNNRNIVIEGNRRLAVLRLLRDDALAKRLGVRIPTPLHEDAKPETVKIWEVGHRRDARDFIGFKHINGAFKWDSFAKAKYAAEWLDEDPDVAAVSRRLGDTHNTVVRLVNGYRVLRQSERQGFDREKLPRRFSFSHLYTALTRPSVRSYVGLEEGTGLLGADPIPDTHSKDLHQLITWLYGDEETDPVIKSQNPDLGRLVSVLGNESATRLLEAHPSLPAAFELVEDKRARFTSEMAKLLDQTKIVSSLIGSFDGDQSTMEMATTVQRTVKVIVKAMEAETSSLSPRGKARE